MKSKDDKQKVKVRLDSVNHIGLNPKVVKVSQCELECVKSAVSAPGSVMASQERIRVR